MDRPPLLKGFGQDTRLQQRVYDRIAQAVLAGQLKPGDRLPSTRELARSLGIGRNTVTWAFEQLAAEGFIETRHGSGTFVSSELRSHARLRKPSPAIRPVKTTARLARRAERYATVAQSLRVPQKLVPFRINMPAIDVFPIVLWRRLMNALLSDEAIGGHTFLGEVEPAGYAPLREAIARYLIINRGVQCSPDQVIIVAGAQQGLDLAVRLLLDPGDTAWCEDPGFPGSIAALRAGGAKIGAVPVDRDGIDIEFGKARHPEARLAVVCPSSQFPLGSTMSLSRRLALIDWARRRDAWIIEDDYDSEFRYRGRPVHSLQGLDGGSRVVYVGTFSKLLFPGLRLAYLVVPKSVVEPFINARIVAGRQSPTLEQAVVERFMSEGHLGRHIARMRRLYTKRRQLLIEACRDHMKDLLHIQPSDASLQTIAWLPNDFDDQAVSRDAAEAGLEIPPLSRLTIERRLPPALLLGFGHLTEMQIRSGAARLATILKSHRRRSQR